MRHHLSPHHPDDDDHIWGIHKLHLQYSYIYRFVCLFVCHVIILYGLIQPSAIRNIFAVLHKNCFGFNANMPNYVCASNFPCDVELTYNNVYAVFEQPLY